MKPVLVQITDALTHEKINTERFRNQLVNLITSSTHEQLLERIEKGSAYYRKLILDQLRLLLNHLESVKRQKRVKTYLAQLQEIDQLLSRKLTELHQAHLIVEQIIRGTELFDLRAVRTTVDTERAKLLQETNASFIDKPAKKKSREKRK